MTLVQAYISEAAASNEASQLKSFKMRVQR